MLSQHSPSSVVVVQGADSSLGVEGIDTLFTNQTKSLFAQSCTGGARHVISSPTNVSHYAEPDDTDSPAAVAALRASKSHGMIRRSSGIKETADRE